MGYDGNAFYAILVPDPGSISSPHEKIIVYTALRNLRGRVTNTVLLPARKDKTVICELYIVPGGNAIKN